ncbi:MAG: class I SAM-dependent methyltransferase [Bacilli bacterium]|nr:class I SAM-dependent methyltransferase [Bacilli bacterium]
MSNQYFENNENLKSNIQTIRYYFKKTTLLFDTDHGVFSKGGIDFGSNALLQTLPSLEDKTTLLDVGCGYGTMGLTLAKKYSNLTVDMVDVNLRAIDLCKSNALKNDVNNVNVFESNCYENVDKTYDIIISNPPIRAGKKVVFAILEGAYEHLVDDGELWIVIQKKQGAESSLKHLRELYENVEIVNKDGGYWIIKSRK